MKREANNRQKYFDHLNGLHAEERLDILKAVTKLRAEFPDLTNKEAARILMQWLTLLEDTEDPIDW